MNNEQSNKRTGNALWLAGGKSPNPNGRPKYRCSSLTIIGKIERGLNGYFGSRQEKKDLLAVAPEFRLNYNIRKAEVLGLKQQSISQEQLLAAFDNVQKMANNVADQKKAG